MTALSADRPSTDPRDDLFGHAPFAKTLADSICRYPGSDGLVLALYGPWGSGKSTILSYVRHYLGQRPDEEQPVVVTFNPWWFSGQEHLARTFLGQLQAVLPEKSPKLVKLRELLRDYGEGIGGFIDLSGITGGVGATVGSLLSRPKDITALKDAIVEALVAAQQKILVVIDDIDRLTPEEVRQLFTVIKALADFPNVIYLLAFDREVAVDAIKQQTGLPGERFLEKIIQVPFEIPPVDRESLRVALFKRLDEVLVGTPDGMFDQSYWTNVFYDGIDSLIKVPRDIVRFANTLSVTYPSVVGEVNPVDFIAVEALRVFLPYFYDVVRNNQDQFSGYSAQHLRGETDEAARQAFHEAWQQKLPEETRASAMGLLRRIFPKLENMTYGGEWISEWRRKQRVCVPELFPTYFRLSIPLGVVRRSEILALLALADNPASLGEKLAEAVDERRANGLSKARALLERLMDYVEKDIPAGHIPIFVGVLLDVGDELVLPGDAQGMFDIGNEALVVRLVYHLLKRVEKDERLPLLRDAFGRGSGIGVQQHLMAMLIDEANEQPGGDPGPFLNPAAISELRDMCVDKIRSRGDNLLPHTRLSRLLGAWREWGDAEEVRNWCLQVTASEEGLLAFLRSFVSHRKSHSMGDWSIRIQPRLNPTLVEEYLDIETVAARLTTMVNSGRVPESAKEAVSQFLKEVEMIKAGKNPDGLFAFDD